jgi:hypothetical protein
MKSPPHSYTHSAFPLISLKTTTERGKQKTEQEKNKEISLWSLPRIHASTSQNTRAYFGSIKCTVGEREKKLLFFHDSHFLEHKEAAVVCERPFSHLAFNVGF